MDNSFPQQGSDTRQRRGFLPGLQIFDRIPSWLTRLMRLMQLAEEERKAAGIYIGEQRDE
jgi:hypothetical protein